MGKDEALNYQYNIQKQIDFCSSLYNKAGKNYHVLHKKIKSDPESFDVLELFVLEVINKERLLDELYRLLEVYNSTTWFKEYINTKLVGKEFKKSIYFTDCGVKITNHYIQKVEDMSSTLYYDINMLNECIDFLEFCEMKR